MPSGSVPLVGRAAEVGILRAAAEAALAGVLVRGPAGSGKTRLLDLLAGWADEFGAVVHRGAAWDSSAAPPLWPWREIARDGIGGRDPAALVGDLGPSLRALVGSTPTEGVPVAPRDVPAIRGERFAAVVALLRALAAEKPRLVILDDVHAADPQTWELMRFAVPRLRGRPILLAVGLRDVDGGVPQEFDAPTVLRLDGLDIAAVRELAAWCGLGTLPPDAIGLVHAATGGNPLHLVQALAAMQADLDPVTAALNPGSLGRLRDLVQQRFGRLSGDAQAVLAAAAVVGRDVTLPVLARVLGRRLVAAARPLEEVAGAGLLVPVGVGRYRFTHELIREAVYGTLGDEQAALLHRAAGEALQRMHGIGRDDVLAAVAHHYLLAAPVDGASARRALTAAADRAVAAMAYEQAVAGYRAALDVAAFDDESSPANRADLLLRVAEARRLAGDPAAARIDFLAAAQIARELADGARLAAAALGMGTTGYLAVVDAERLALVGEALTLVPATMPALRARLLVAGAQELITDSRSVQRRRTMVEEAVELALAQPDPAVRAEVFTHSAAPLNGPDTLARRVALLDSAVAAAQEGNRPEPAFQAGTWRFGACLERGAFGAAREQLAVLGELAERLRLPRFGMYVAARYATLALLDGRLDDVLSLTDDARRLAEDAGELPGAMVAAEVTAHVALLRGDRRLLESAELAFRDVVRQSADIPSFRIRQAHLQAALGEQGPALALLEHLVANGFATLRAELSGLATLTKVADLAWYLGHHAVAGAVYEELAPWADLHVVEGSGFSYNGPVLLHMGRMAALCGDARSAAAHLDSAAAVAARERLPLISAQVAAAAARVAGQRPRPRGDHAALLRQRQFAERQRVGSVLRDLEEVGATPAPVPTPDPADGVFCAHGDTWEVGIGAERVWLRDRRGMPHLARLLASPHTEIHVLDLLTARVARQGSAHHEGLAATGATGFAALDDRARAAYRDRVVELRTELDEAEACNDLARTDRARMELDALTSELAAAVGLAGRDRRSGNPTERARVSVTRTIRAAIGQIQLAAPAIGEHLAASIRTGTFCMYQPEQRAAVRWQL